MDQEQYFNRISDEYDRGVRPLKKVYDQVAASLNPMIEDATVLDVGNGGQFPYNTRLPKKIIAMDVAKAMLDKIVDPNVTKVVDDARSMDSIPDSSIDVIIFQWVLHHITGDTLRENGLALRKVLEASMRKLKPGGLLAVTETVLNEAMYTVQNILYPATRRVLKSSGRSMIAFFTRSVLVDAISGSCGIAKGDVRVSDLDFDGWIDPLVGSYPGIVRIPYWLNPTRFVMFMARKSPCE